MCFVCISEQTALIPQTALADWFLYPRRSVFTARYGLNLQLVIQVKLDLEESM